VRSVTRRWAAGISITSGLEPLILRHRTPLSRTGFWPLANS